LNDVNEFTPTSINQIIGQQQVRDVVEVALDAAQIDGKRFDHSLLVGPAGMGKSMSANIIAAEMATEFYEVLGQSISSPADLNALLLQAKDRSIIHIDEAHELKKEFQTALYLAIDKRTIFVSGGKNKPVGIPIADFTLLLSTTDEYDLLQPLRDRMRLTLKFDFYTDLDLMHLVTQRARALSWELEENVPVEIAIRGKGIPRIALRLLQSARRVCRAEGEETIRCHHLHRACQLDGLDELGLDRTEQKYLSLLKEGPLRLNVIASSLGLPSRTVSTVTEQFLMRSGLISKDDQSRRQLTDKGHSHLLPTRQHVVQ